MRLAVAALLITAGCATAQTDRYLSPVYKTIAAGNLQSISLAVVVNGSIRHVIAKGYANRWAGVRASPETIYPFESITQTFTATGIVKLAADRKIRLDDPLDRHLAGVQIKAQEPDAPVTIRQVLAHASGLVESREPLEMHTGAMPSMPTALLFSNILLAGNRPLSVARFSNVGYGALGMLLTGVAGQTIPEYFRDAWLDPLGMSSTAFNVSGRLQERLAMGYTRPPDGEPAAMKFAYHSPSSPLLAARGMCGTASDLARWLVLHLQGGKNADRELVPEAAIRDMHRVQFPQLRGKKYNPQSLFESDDAGWGLGWIAWTCDGGHCIGHVSSSPGYTSVVAGNLDRKTGVAILSNSDGAESVLVKLAQELLRISNSETLQ